MMMAKLPRIDSEGLRLAAKEGHRRVSSVSRISLSVKAKRKKKRSAKR